jgi:hypothetical protein
MSWTVFSKSRMMHVRIEQHSKKKSILKLGLTTPLSIPALVEGVTNRSGNIG